MCAYDKYVTSSRPQQADNALCRLTAHCAGICYACNVCGYGTNRYYGPAVFQSIGGQEVIKEASVIRSHPSG